MAVEFDPERVLRTLNQQGVDYVVVGGLASILLGAPIVTNDVDVCYDRSPENLERLVLALRELGARLRVAGVDDDLPFILDARTLAAGDCFTFMTDAGAVDILGTPAGTSGFKDLRSRSTEYDFGGGLRARVVDLDDLIRMKEAAGRPKDEVHLHQLTVLREMLEEQTQRSPES
jgi:hypothetical protein